LQDTDGLVSWVIAVVLHSARMKRS
jgi:hypothetical protein